MWQDCLKCRLRYFAFTARTVDTGREVDTTGGFCQGCQGNRVKVTKKDFGDQTKLLAALKRNYKRLQARGDVK